MREIKFRAKSDDKETQNRWFYGGYAKLDKTTYCFKEDYDRNPDNTVHYIIFDEMTDWGLPNRHLRASINPETIGQFTGLKDKHGIEIYEDDIVKVKNIDYLIGKVVYDKEYLCYQIEVDEQVIFPVSVCYGDYNELDIEVIGNIWDNPELLKESDNKCQN